jgi:hypothetical protein
MLGPDSTLLVTEVEAAWGTATLSLTLRAEEDRN